LSHILDLTQIIWINFGSYSDTFYYLKCQYIDNDDTKTIQEIEAEETEAEEIETEDIELKDQEKNKQIEEIEDTSTLNILDDSDKKGSLVWNHFDKFADKKWYFMAKYKYCR